MIEDIILPNLIERESYARKVLPFLKVDYFTSVENKILFKLLQKYVNKYNSVPSKATLKLIVEDTNSITEEQYNSLISLLDSMEPGEHEEEWLLDSTEDFCQSQAIYNAVKESISIIDNRHKNLDKGSIPSILSEALAVSFDNHIGHDFIEDYDERYEFYRRKEEKIGIDIDIFNDVTKGGFSRKSLSVALAGCVHPSTKVQMILLDDIEWTDPICVSIGIIEGLLKLGFKVKVNSPDGYVLVNDFIRKGFHEEYVLLSDFGEYSVRCNADHLFETDTGWMSAKAIYESPTFHKVLTSKGDYVLSGVFKTGDSIPIVDISVDSEKHRYYTNFLVSHNTGVGKTLFMTHCASSMLTQGYNVLYITMEMAEERIAERIDANILDLSMENLRTIPKETYTNIINKVKSNTKGKLIIKEYPTASAGSAHFRHLINELRLKKNFVPDVIFVDYINICTSSRMKAGSGVNSYTIVKSIAEELRGLAVEFNLPLISATQTTREGMGSSDLELTDTSESIGLPQTCDFMFGLITSEELEESNKILVKILKNRWNDPNFNKRFFIGVDRSKMRLYNSDASKDYVANEVSSGNTNSVFDNTNFGNADESRTGKRKTVNI